MYSKSCLRTAADIICAKHDFVDYFPSYESILYSDRSVAFAEDGIHVQEAAVAFNVDRMLMAYLA